MDSQERVGQNRFSNRAVIVEVERPEERLVDLPSPVVGGFAVERLRIARQVDRACQDAGTGIEVGVNTAETQLHTGPLVTDLVHAVTDNRVRERGVLDRGNELLLALVECLEFLVEVALHVAADLLIVCQCVIERIDELGRVFRCQLEVLVEVDDLLLDLCRWEIWQLAAFAVLATTTEEVTVGATVALGLGVEQTAFLPRFVATVAAQHALEVVLQDSVSDTTGGASVEDVLGAVEQSLVDQCLMTAVVQFALVDGVSGVVRITEHPVQGVNRQRLLDLPPSGRASAQAVVFHGFLERIHRVVTCRIQLEGQAHQRCTLLIDDDGVDHAAIHVDAGVEVADRSAADSAAVFGLVRHLHLDVFAVALVLQVIHGVGDDFHELGFDRVAEVLFGADDLHAEAA